MSPAREVSSLPLAPPGKPFTLLLPLSQVLGPSGCVQSFLHTSVSQTPWHPHRMGILWQGPVGLRVPRVSLLPLELVRPSWRGLAVRTSPALGSPAAAAKKPPGGGLLRSQGGCSPLFPLPGTPSQDLLPLTQAFMLYIAGAYTRQRDNAKSLQTPYAPWIWLLESWVKLPPRCRSPSGFI